MKRLFLLVLFSLCLAAQGQVRDTLRIVDQNKDTTLVIKTTTQRTSSISYTETSVTTVKKPYLTPPVIDPPPTDPGSPQDPGIPIGYKVTFSNGYNSTADITANQKPSGISLSSFISTTTKRTGTGSFKSFTNGQSTSSGIRCEEQYNQASANPTEFILDFYILFPNYKATGWGGSVGFQYHPNNNGSANLFLYGTEGRFNFARYIDLNNPSGTNGTSYYQTNGGIVIQSNTWYHVRVFGKWSTGGDGYFRAYINDMGNPYYTFSGRTQDNSGKPYLKVGQNNWGGSVGVEQEIDDLTIYSK